MIKKAVILAAGRGTRLQPLTYDLPKPMIPLLGKPVCAPGTPCNDVYGVGHFKIVEK